MSRILIDTNVIIDLVVQDNEWRKWSAQAVNEAARHSRLVINQIILAEVSIGFERSEDVDALRRTIFEMYQNRAVADAPSQNLAALAGLMSH